MPFTQEVEVVVARSRRRRSLPAPPLRRRIREAARVTQAEVGRALGVSRVAVGYWEAGRFTPRDELMDGYLTLLVRLAEETGLGRSIEVEVGLDAPDAC